MGPGSRRHEACRDFPSDLGGRGGAAPHPEVGPLKNFAFALAAATALAPALSHAESSATSEAGNLRRTLETERSELQDAWVTFSEPFVWMGENLHFDDKAGLEYRQEMRLGDRPVELRLKGPVVRKKRGFGLTVVVRF